MGSQCSKCLIMGVDIIIFYLGDYPDVQSKLQFIVLAGLVNLPFMASSGWHPEQASSA